MKAEKALLGNILEISTKKPQWSFRIAISAPLADDKPSDTHYELKDFAAWRIAPGEMRRSGRPFADVGRVDLAAVAYGARS